MRSLLIGTWRPRGEATVRRVLARIDVDALDRAIGARLAAQQPPPPSPYGGRSSTGSLPVTMSSD
jgi:hypothetical protein